MDRGALGRDGASFGDIELVVGIRDGGEFAVAGIEADGPGEEASGLGEFGFEFAVVVAFAAADGDGELGAAREVDVRFVDEDAGFDVEGGAVGEREGREDVGALEEAEDGVDVFEDDEFEVVVGVGRRGVAEGFERLDLGARDVEAERCLAVADYLLERLDAGILTGPLGEVDWGAAPLSKG